MKAAIKIVTLLLPPVIMAGTVYAGRKTLVPGWFGVAAILGFLAIILWFKFRSPRGMAIQIGLLLLLAAWGISVFCSAVTSWAVFTFNPALTKKAAIVFFPLALCAGGIGALFPTRIRTLSTAQLFLLVAGLSAFEVVVWQGGSLLLYLPVEVAVLFVVALLGKWLYPFFSPSAGEPPEVGLVLGVISTAVVELGWRGWIFLLS